MGRLPGEIEPDRGSRTTLQTIPLFHMGGLQTIGTNLLTGAKIVFLEHRFSAGEVLRLIEQEKVTTWGCVPTMMSRVLEHPELQTRDTSSLRSITMGGSSVPPALTARAARAFPQAARNLHAVYGLTEAGGSVTSASGRDAAAHPGTVGRPLPVVELRFKDADDEGVGEFLVRSPSNMLGYWETAESPIDDDGFLHTGDLGYPGEDGYVYLVGRSKDVIIRGGENIASSHVEACLREHPDVVDVAVLGLPNEDLGEEVGAVTVLRDGTELTAEQLQEFARARLASFEVPTRWWIRTTPLPTSAIGKVLKAEVLQEWKQAGEF
jgi:long-chain acyl-CoA synthetase